VRAVGFVAGGLALLEGRIGEQGGGERLQRQRDAEFLHHVRLARIIEVGLDGAGPQHHVEPERTHARHVAEHDVVAPLGHDRQLGARLVRPETHAEEADAKRIANLLHLREMAAGFGAGLVQIIERRARKLELAGGLEADAAVLARKRDDVATLVDRLPAELGEPDHQRVDAAFLFIGRRAVIGEAIDELLVFGAYPPAFLGLFAIGEHRDQIVAGFDLRIGCGVGGAGRHDRALAATGRYGKRGVSPSRPPSPSTATRRPARRFRRAGCGGRAICRPPGAAPGSPRVPRP
jgi:hypothetical protein